MSKCKVCGDTGIEKVYIEEKEGKTKRYVIPCKECGKKWQNTYGLY